MSLDLNRVSKIVYLGEGKVNPGDEAKVERYESQLSDWKCDVHGNSKIIPTKEDMSSEMHQLGNNFGGY